MFISFLSFQQPLHHAFLHLGIRYHLGWPVHSEATAFVRCRHRQSGAQPHLFRTSASSPQLEHAVSGRSTLHLVRPWTVDGIAQVGKQPHFCISPRIQEEGIERSNGVDRLLLRLLQASFHSSYLPLKTEILPFLPVYLFRPQSLQQCRPCIQATPTTPTHPSTPISRLKQSPKLPDLHHPNAHNQTLPLHLPRNHPKDGPPAHPPTAPAASPAPSPPA